MINFHFDFLVIWKNLGVLGRGLTVTIEFTVICILLGSALGFLLALARTSSINALSRASAGYVEIFRGTPVLIQLFWIFFCLPLVLGIGLSNCASSIVALTLFMGAISSETFRSALKSIPKEHHDASTALGLSAFQRIRYIVFPQAIRFAISNLLSNSVSLFKESSLVSAVGMVDLMYIGQTISNRTARPLEILTAVAFLYFVVAFPATRLVSFIERRLIKQAGG